MKKLLSLLLCLIFVFCAAIPTAWADDASEESADNAEDGGEIPVGDGDAAQELYPQFGGEFITDDDGNAHFSVFSSVGDTLALSVSAESSGTLSYQWQMQNSGRNYDDLSEKAYPGAATDTIGVVAKAAMIYAEDLFACVVTADDGTDTAERTAFFTLVPSVKEYGGRAHGQVSLSEYTKTGGTAPDIERTITDYGIGDTLGGAVKGKYKRINLNYANTNGADGTVLLVDLTALCCRFVQPEEDEQDENPYIRSIVYSDDFKKMAILLNDTVASISGGDMFIIPLNLMYTPLTDDECAAWLAGEDISGNILAYEYRIPSSYSGSFSGFAKLLFGGKVSFNTLSRDWYFLDDKNGDAQRDICPTVPDTYDNEGFAAPVTYKAAVNCLPAATGNTPDKDGISASVCLPENAESCAYRLEIPTVSKDVPLMEITEVRIYSPSDKLKLSGICEVTDSTVPKPDDYYRIWQSWEISSSGSDAYGDYYVLTPPDGVHYYNNGDDAHTEKLTYGGFVLLWSLKDSADPLEYNKADDKDGVGYLTYKGGADTLFAYSVPEGCAAAGGFLCAAPVISVSGENKAESKSDPSPVIVENSEPATTVITVKNICLNPRNKQTFVYRIEDSSGRSMEFAMEQNENMKIYNVAVGSVTITQDTNWSWRCTIDEASQTQTVSADSTDAANTFTFTNTVTNVGWLSYCCDISRYYAEY